MNKLIVSADSGAPVAAASTAVFLAFLAVASAARFNLRQFTFEPMQVLAGQALDAFRLYANLTSSSKRHGLMPSCSNCAFPVTVFLFAITTR